MGDNSNKILLTIDVEEWYHIPSVTGSPFSVYKDYNHFFSEWKNKYDYISEPLQRILSLLDSYNLTATFFIVSDIANTHPSLIEKIVDGGHEIACHGLHHSCSIHPTNKTPLCTVEGFENETKKAINILKKYTNEKVKGYRAPNALIGGWMLDSLERIGIKYDSSVSKNSLYNKTDSNLQGVTTAPYRPHKNTLIPHDVNRQFIEFPWSYLDLMSFKLPTSGGPILRFLGPYVISSGLSQSLRRGHTVFYFHPLDICIKPFPHVGKGRPLYWAIKGNIVEKYVNYIIKKHKTNICPIRDIK